MQRTEIFVAMVIYPRFEGAAHRNIKFNVTVRCTFNHDVADFATNITVRCTFNHDVTDFGYKCYGALHLQP